MRSRLVPTLAALALLAYAAPARAQAKAAPLSNGDCAKCHTDQPNDIATAGGKHKTEVGCQDCHTGHRPTSKSNIPQCSMCHDGKDHFKLGGCLGCHKNPHTPKNIVLGPGLTEPCLSCHAKVGEELKANKSKHSSRACTFCHKAHGQKPECVGCHKPHSEATTPADCRKCHKAHSPKNVTYAENTPNAMCGACHRQPAALLAASQAKHHELACGTCHQEKHRAVPKCEDCHADQHPAAFMARFGSCVACHKDPHDLNNWGPGGGPAGAKAAHARRTK